MNGEVFTIGHSTHLEEYFAGLLRQHGITALCDVRSKPYSRFNPQFNRDRIQETLRAAGIEYVFLGKELGARSDDPSCYEHGKVRYERLARTELFRRGIERVREGLAMKFRLALMCAEREPLECHRTILVARHLEGLGIRILHIHADGNLESQEDALSRLARQLHVREPDMFRSEADVIADAYKLQEDRIAHRAEPAKQRTLLRG